MRGFGTVFAAFVMVMGLSACLNSCGEGSERAGAVTEATSSGEARWWEVPAPADYPSDEEIRASIRSRGIDSTEEWLLERGPAGGHGIALCGIKAAEALQAEGRGREAYRLLKECEAQLADDDFYLYKVRARREPLTRILVDQKRAEFIDTIRNDPRLQAEVRRIVANAIGRLERGEGGIDEISIEEGRGEARRERRLGWAGRRMKVHRHAVVDTSIEVSISQFDWNPDEGGEPTYSSMGVAVNVRVQAEIENEGTGERLSNAVLRLDSLYRPGPKGDWEACRGVHVVLDPTGDWRPRGLVNAE